MKYYIDVGLSRFIKCDNFDERKLEKSQIKEIIGSDPRTMIKDEYFCGVRQYLNKITKNSVHCSDIESAQSFKSKDEVKIFVQKNNQLLKNFAFFHEYEYSLIEDDGINIRESNVSELLFASINRKIVSMKETLPIADGISYSGIFPYLNRLVVIMNSLNLPDYCLNDLLTNNVVMMTNMMSCEVVNMDSKCKKIYDLITNLNEKRDVGFVYHVVLNKNSYTFYCIKDLNSIFQKDLKIYALVYIVQLNEDDSIKSIQKSIKSTSLNEIKADS